MLSVSGAPARLPFHNRRAPEAAVVAVEVDHTAGGRRRHARQGEELLDHPATAEAGQAHARIARQRLVDHKAALVLADRLVRIEERGDRIGLLRIRHPLRLGETQRVLRVRLVLLAADHRDARRLADVERELGVRDAARGGRVVAVAVGVEPAVRADVADAVVGAGRFDAELNVS
jgi:hypothetical protein